MNKVEARLFMAFQFECAFQLSSRRLSQGLTNLLS